MEKPSITEKEWECQGFKCRVIFVRQTHRCGYVGIPKDHVAYDKNYDDLPIEVHGGLTYGKIEDDGLCWFGFDCAHSGDTILGMKEYGFPVAEKNHFWTLEEAVKETEKMPKQFKELTLGDIIKEKMRWMPDWFKDNVTIKVK